MTTFNGADLVQLRDLKQRLDVARRELVDGDDALRRRLADVTVWSGPDAEAFRNEWTVLLRRRFADAAEGLRLLGRSVRLNADEQERVSARLGGGVGPVQLAPAAGDSDGRHAVGGGGAGGDETGGPGDGDAPVDLGRPVLIDAGERGQALDGQAPEELVHPDPAPEIEGPEREGEGDPAPGLPDASDSPDGDGEAVGLEDGPVRLEDGPVRLEDGPVGPEDDDLVRLPDGDGEAADLVGDDLAGDSGVGGDTPPSDGSSGFAGSDQANHSDPGEPQIAQWWSDEDVPVAEHEGADGGAGPDDGSVGGLSDDFVGADPVAPADPAAGPADPGAPAAPAEHGGPGGSNQAAFPVAAVATAAAGVAGGTGSAAANQAKTRRDQERDDPFSKKLT